MPKIFPLGGHDKEVKVLVAAVEKQCTLQRINPYGHCPTYIAVFSCTHVLGNQRSCTHASGPNQKLHKNQVVYMHDKEQDVLVQNVGQAHKLSKKEILREFSFIFLPHKKNSNKRISCPFKLLSLKDSGWGPPAGDARQKNKHC